MSVTFSVIDGPWIETGFGPEPEHAMNLANMNARALLRTLGIDGTDLIGNVTAEEVSDMRRLALAAKNRPDSRAPNLREDEHEASRLTGARGIKLTDGTVRLERLETAASFTYGLDDEDMLDYLERLDAILVKAQELGKGVCWS